MPKINEYCYLITRKDISQEQIVVQTAHAAMEGGIYFGKKTAEPYYFAVLEVPNEKALKELMGRIDNETDIAYRAFIEPDQGFKFTSICTEPISKEKGKFFRKYPKLTFGK